MDLFLSLFFFFFEQRQEIESQLEELEKSIQEAVAKSEYEVAGILDNRLCWQIDESLCSGLPCRETSCIGEGLGLKVGGLE